MSNETYISHVNLVEISHFQLKKKIPKTQPSIYLTLVHIPEEKGYFSHMSIVAL